ncbi:MAG: hypothetical protein A2Z77_06140 [Chloroflexi bacterium RBG_13_51_36]|nr:MAG: hypothetical protein A2Z77_06140 [Chloroflexi bacterium RBG_13_51_36]
MRDMKIRTAVTSAMVAVILLLSLFSVVLAAPTADSSRTIDPQVVEPGGEVDITVEFTSLLAEDKGFALQEIVPDGWEFTEGTNDGGVLKILHYPTIEWLWLGVGAGATKTITYTLTVPLDADPGDYVINGTVTADGVVNPTGGDNTITVSGEALYELTMAADPDVGGTATDLTDDSPYAEGAEVSIEAVAAQGYQFVNWTAPAGGFGNASAQNTIFTMPAQNVTVTAHFEALPPGSPTVSTQAVTDITTSSATLNMNFTVGDFSSVDVRFAYKKSADSAWSYTAWESKSASGTYAKSQTALSSGTQYDYKAQLKYDETVVEGTTHQFTTQSSAQPGGCCFATTALGTSTAKQLDVLREFRDNVLLESTAGSQFVSLYYHRISPPIVNLLSGNSFLKTLVRELLVDPIVWVIEATGDLWGTGEAYQ